LFSGESLYWAGIPNPKVIFHSDDWTLIPFTLVWTGIWVFWEGQALGIWEPRKSELHVFDILWRIPFLLYGSYMVFGRFLTDAWLKRRTYYAVTNRRALVLQAGLKKNTSMIFLETITTIEQEGGETGTIWFGPKYPLVGRRGEKNRSMSRFSIGDTPVFADIDGVDSVHKLVLDLRAKAGVGQTPRLVLTYE